MDKDFFKREMKVVPGYPEDFQDTFENYIDCFTPLDNIVQICKIEFGMQYEDLDKFCYYVYNMNLKESYIHLLRMADMISRKAVTGLARAGNKTAMSIMSDYFAKWSAEQQKVDAKIVINASIPSNKNKEEK